MTVDFLFRSIEVERRLGLGDEFPTGRLEFGIELLVVESFDRETAFVTEDINTDCKSYYLKKKIVINYKLLHGTLTFDSNPECSSL